MPSPLSRDPQPHVAAREVLAERRPRCADSRRPPRPGHRWRCRQVDHHAAELLGIAAQRAVAVEAAERSRPSRGRRGRGTSRAPIRARRPSGSRRRASPPRAHSGAGARSSARRARVRRPRPVAYSTLSWLTGSSPICCTRLLAAVIGLRISWAIDADSRSRVRCVLALETCAVRRSTLCWMRFETSSSTKRSRSFGS